MRMHEDAVEGGGHRLDVLVVGGHSVAHQAVRCGQAVEHIDAHRHLLLGGQRLMTAV